MTRQDFTSYIILIIGIIVSGLVIHSNYTRGQATANKCDHIRTETTGDRICEIKL